MITAENFKELLKISGFKQDITGTLYTYNFENFSMSADFSAEKLIYPEKITGREHNSGFDANENFVVFECVFKLLKKGYKPEDIELEKTWKLGHVQKSGRADICIYKDENHENVLMIIECKTYGYEFSKALNDTKTDGAQLFSYWQQEISTEWLMLYASDIQDGKIIYRSTAIDCNDDKNLLNHSKRDEIKLYVNAHTVKEKFEVWHDTYNLEVHDDIIFSDRSSAYNIGINPLRKKDLKPFTEDDKKGIINSFEEILRHNNVSDKENAFNRLIALFICKLVDEIMKNDFDEVSFQYRPRRDTYEELQDRLQRLYTEGMREFMREEITYISSDYPAKLFANYNGGNRKEAIKELADTFRKLKFFTNNDFAFMDVHNEELFYKNGKILVEVVQLFQKYKIVHTEKHQLLGDLFEQLLDKGFKQNEGQFFTPIVITRFIWDCIPMKRYEKWPKVIDYACGAAHFLTEAVEAINYFIPSKNNTWTRDCIFGIEKDYRLARVSKVSMFMNGAGDSNIIFGEGLENTPLIKPAAFDILTANPPYSVASFKQHLRLNGTKYNLLEKISGNGSEIEVLFVERMGQLLNDGGIAAVILPSSILSNDSASYTGAREEILKHFKIRAIVKLGNNTFGATGTNTVIMFLERYDHHPPRKAHVKDSVDAIFEDRNLEDWEDVYILSGYLEMQGLTHEQWRDFIYERLDINNMPEYFRGYLEAFGAEKFYLKAKAVEREKIFCYGMTYKQRTTIILAPSDNAGQREFLGYYWSNRKGDEGIKFLGERGGKLYVNHDREAEGTLAHVVRQSFSDDDIVMTDDNLRYSRVVRTCNMFDFSRVGFNASMNLQPQQKIINMEGKITLSKVFDVINDRIDTSLLNPEQYITTETMLQNCKGITTFTGELPKGTVYKFKEGDILLSNIRPYLQKIYFADFEGGCSTNVFVFRSKNEELYNSKYIFYMMTRKAFFDYVMLNTKGLSMPQGRREHILDYVIPLPPMNIQREIVKECGEVDAQENALNSEISSCREKINTLFNELEYETGKCSLADVLMPITDRIDAHSLKPSQYVTTDTMLQKCEGIREYDKDLPSGTVIRFQKGDILLSNIRPYLRKLWLADFDGGCSSDVLVFRSVNEDIYSGRYIFYAMRQDKFFDFVMQNVNGLKMPRGNKAHIMRYTIPAPSQAQQKKFLDVVTELEDKISENITALKNLSGKKELILKKYL